MYAIFKSGGKQHRVVPGEVIALEQLTGEAGTQVAFDNVLLVSDEDNTQVGTPLLDGASVSATIVEHFRDKKIIVFKKKRRKKYRRKQGHRQNLTRVRIDSISV
jgi:large subunit ribosomal protein L21